MCTSPVIATSLSGLASSPLCFHASWVALASEAMRRANPSASNKSQGLRKIERSMRGVVFSLESKAWPAMKCSASLRDKCAATILPSAESVMAWPTASESKLLGTSIKRPDKNMKLSPAANSFTGKPVRCSSNVVHSLGAHNEATPRR